MLVELTVILFSLILAVYSTSRYLKAKIKSMLHFTVCFAFLTASTTLVLIDSLVWFPATMTVLRLIEVASLALYTCFTIIMIIALRKLSEPG